MTIQSGRTLFGSVPSGFFGLLEKVEPGLMLDVGAAAGYFTELMRAKSPQSRVKAFEPFPGNFDYFKKRIGDDPLVEFFPKAVSNAPGHSRFHVPHSIVSGEGNWKQYAGYSSVGFLVSNDDDRPTIDVEVCRIDDVVDERIRFMKIDVQGAEFQVLDGASRTFADHGIDMMFVEYTGGIDILGLILGRGYHVYDSEYTIITKKKADLAGWDVVGEVMLSTGRKAVRAWPKKAPTDPGEYCRFFVEESRRIGAFFTDLVCLTEEADAEVRRLLPHSSLVKRNKEGVAAPSGPAKRLKAITRRSKKKLKFWWRQLSGDAHNNGRPIGQPASAAPLTDQDVLKWIAVNENYGKIRNDVARRLLYESQQLRPIVCEHDASDVDLAHMLRHIERVWSAYGETDPHWSVVTVPRFRRDVIKENERDFYETGRREAEALDLLLARNGIVMPESARWLEYGCGVGRVTRWLAARAGHVTGVDISANHLKLAGDYCRLEGVSNVDWLRIKSIDDVAELPYFDLLYSKIVLQHNPPPIISRILDLALSRANPGAVAVFQVPTYKKNYEFRVTTYLDQLKQINALEMHVLPQQKVFELLSKHGFTLIEIQRDHLVTQADFVSNTFVARKA